MTTATIFGNGNMATAIGGILTDANYTVEHIGSKDAGATPVAGELVILAVPYPAVAQIVEQYGDQLAGKTVVDITNPLDFSTFDSLVVPADSSAAEELQQALPNSSVLKAFNTNFAGTLAAKKIGELPTTVLIAGNDDDAKKLLKDAVEAGGLSAVDAGALSRARELEAVGFLQLTLAAAEKISWTGGFGLVR